MPENIIENKNIVWIDIAKFIGIFLVVFGHVMQTFNLGTISFFKHLWQFIYLFHMPLFFIITGYLYKSKSKSDNYKKILWGLLIPYLIYQFVYLPFRIGNLILFYHIDILQVLLKCMFGIICGDFVDSAFFFPVCGPCWFIMSIIQLRLLFNNINLNIKNLILLSILSIIILKFLLMHSCDLYFCIDNTLMAIPYFAFGYILKIVTFRGFNWGKHRLISSPVLILACCFLLLVILNYNGLIQMNLVITEKLQNKSLLLAYLGGTIGTFMVIIFSDFFNKENKFIKTIAKNTLFIIFFHWLLLFFTRWLKLQLITTYFSNILSKFMFVVLFSTLILIVSYFTIKFLGKYCPLVLGKYQPKGEMVKCS